MSRPLKVNWREADTVESLRKDQLKSKTAERRKRAQCFYLLRKGYSLSQSCEIAGVGYRTMQRWLAWYKIGGMDMVYARVRGIASTGRPKLLTPDQEQELSEVSQADVFTSKQQLRQYVLDRFGVAYTYRGIYPLLSRLGIEINKKKAA